MIIGGFCDYHEDQQKYLDSLLPLKRACETLACSSAECERGFSLLNLILTALRNQLLIQNVVSLMFIKLKGPPLDLWNLIP